MQAPNLTRTKQAQKEVFFSGDMRDIAENRAKARYKSGDSV